jgi:hypothetical protein
MCQGALQNLYSGQAFIYEFWLLLLLLLLVVVVVVWGGEAVVLQ